jgi:hypothetical protein
MRASEGAYNCSTNILVRARATVKAHRTAVRAHRTAETQRYALAVVFLTISNSRYEVAARMLTVMY